jgi:hypothetical protein
MASHVERVFLVARRALGDTRRALIVAVIIAIVVIVTTAVLGYIDRSDDATVPFDWGKWLQ